MLQLQLKDQADQRRERVKARSSLLRQFFLLPLTGGLSLLKFLRSLFEND